MGLPYGINCDRVARHDVNGCDASGVMCHTDGVCVGGWGECEHGGVEVSGGGGVLWQVDRGMVDEDGAVGRATGS